MANKSAGIKTGIKKWAILAAVIVIVVFIVPLGAFLGQSAEIDFETVSQSPGFGTANGEHPMLTVVTSPPPDPIFGLSPEDQSAVDSTDYSRYFLLLAMWGSSGSSESRITNIYQYKKTIWVLADLPDKSRKQIDTAPYEIARIERSRIEEYGNITFRLLKNFEEKTRTVQSISAGQLSSHINP